MSTTRPRLPGTVKRPRELMRKVREAAWRERRSEAVRKGRESEEFIRRFRELRPGRMNNAVHDFISEAFKFTGDSRFKEALVALNDYDLDVGTPHEAMKRLTDNGEFDPNYPVLLTVKEAMDSNGGNLEVALEIAASDHAVDALSFKAATQQVRRWWTRFWGRPDIAQLKLAAMLRARNPG